MKKREKQKLKRIISIIFVIIVILIIIIFFSKNTAKVFKSGNNKTSQEIVDYILNTSSYNVKVTVEVESNKNSNKYILKQKFTSPNKCEQEVLEPSNIAGVKIINDGEKLKIENTNLDLVKIFEDYSYLGNNALDLSTFIEEYKTLEEANFTEDDKSIIMKIKNKNKYISEKTLYVDKNTYKPTKLEVKDDKQKTVIYILYNEVELNSNSNDEMLAFRLFPISYNV